MQLAALYFINKKENIMAKINIYFNNSKFEIDASSFSDIKNYLVSHLGTIAGEGLKITVDGVEYSVDPNKLADASASLEATLNNLNSSDTPDDNERLEGDGAEYYTLAPTALSFRSTAPLNELNEVQINGVTVDPANYTLEEGSTIVTFPIDYLKTLNVGNYEVAVASESKTVKGDFVVKAPELNEYGFYYNQPYTAFVSALNDCHVTFFIKNDGTFDSIVFADLNDMTTGRGTYEISGNIITATTSLGVMDLIISDSGMQMHCEALVANFELGNENIVADNDYMYIHDVALGGYGVTAIDKMKTSYSPIRTGINGMDTVKLLNESFSEFVNPNSELIKAPVIPNSVMSIGQWAFYDCSSLTSITLPNSITSIEAAAFAGCISLTSINIPDSVTNISSSAFAQCIGLASITFEGTVAQWNTVTRDYSWDLGVPATHVQCSDGQVAL